jgi:copper chaperone CopZ
MLIEIRVRIRSMGCRRCVREVTAHLRDIPGVQLVTAVVSEGLVVLSGSMSREDVLRALAICSHDAEILDDPALD